MLRFPSAQLPNRQMRILFDHSTPAPLRHYLKEHSVTEARERGWDRLSNGELLKAAEEAGFETLITADKNIRYQQNLSERRIAIVELSTPRWWAIRLQVDLVIATLKAVTPGSYSVVAIDIPSRKNQ